MLCAVASDWENWEKFANESQALREAMMDHLYDDDTGAFALNYDQDRNYQDNFTSDEVFPVLFGVAAAEQRKAILRRLLEADFVTPVGLRTISTADAWYFPSYGFGLLGGIWPDLTLWFAVALARDGFVRRVRAFLEHRLRVDGGRKRAQHRAGRVRRMVRRRIAGESRYVSLALDRRKVSVGGGRDDRRTQRLSHQRPSAFGSPAAQGLAMDRRRARTLGREALQLRRSTSSTIASTATCPNSRLRNLSRASLRAAT